MALLTKIHIKELCLYSNRKAKIPSLVSSGTSGVAESFGSPLAMKSPGGQSKGKQSKAAGESVATQDEIICIAMKALRELQMELDSAWKSRSDGLQLLLNSLSIDLFKELRMNDLDFAETNGLLTKEVKRLSSCKFLNL